MRCVSASTAGFMYGVWKAPLTGVILPDLPEPSLPTSSHTFFSTVLSPETERPSGNM